MIALDRLRASLAGRYEIEREIRVTANLQHPNLLPLFDSGQAGGLLFYVMPFVEGESLRARENVLLHEGQPLVADFGIALAVSKAGGARVTQTGLSLASHCGTSRMGFTMKSHFSMTLSLAAALLTAASGALSAQQRSAKPSGRDQYPHAAEPIATVRQVYDGGLTLQQAVNTFRNIHRLFPTHRVLAASAPMRLPPAAVSLRTVRFSDRGKHYELEDYLELNRVAGLLVLENGRIALERYRFGNSERTRWMSMSVAKSITSTLIGAALKQGYIASLSDPVTRYVPSLAGSAYDGVSVRDVLMMSSGVRWTETYTDPMSDRRRLLEAQISQVPGSAMAVMRALPRAAGPGMVTTYSTGETQVAGEVVRRAVGQPLATYLSERIWSRFGMEADATWWLDSPDGVEIGGSGFSATLRDYGRFGLFVLGGGLAAGEAILPDGWIREATSPKALRGGIPLAYGYLWWTGTTPAAQRDSAYAAEGIYGQWLYVNPAAKVVIVVWSAQRTPTKSAVINDWLFFDAVVDALRRAPRGDSAEREFAEPRLSSTTSDCRVVHGWPLLPTGEILGQATGVAVDSRGAVLVFHRAGRTWVEPFPNERSTLRPYGCSPSTAEMLARRGASLDNLAAVAGLGRVEDTARLLPAADNESKHAALALAAQHGHADVVRLILDAGEDPNRYNPDGFHSHSTPLHQAVSSNHADVVRLLVDRGARLNIRDTIYQGTPLDWAIYNGRTAIAEYLRARGGS